MTAASQGKGSRSFRGVFLFFVFLCKNTKKLINMKIIRLSLQQTEAGFPVFEIILQANSINLTSPAIQEDIFFKKGIFLCKMQRKCGKMKILSLIHPVQSAVFNKALKVLCRNTAYGASCF